ncbi:hypothetical protein LVJ94_44170 [Pendulispora rubella]|uniref:Delta-60 repeat domain-containing protein n=1 Tax=Pendulispora rubella TaxID=2741070 RepID=A0ABZ2KYZ0_9BACT
MKAARSHALRAPVVALLSCSFVAACTALLGVDDLPGRASAKDGGPEPPAEGGADAGIAPGSLDPTFGHHGVAIVPGAFPSQAAWVIADGDDLVLLVLSDQPTLRAIRCSGDGVCDTAHPATLFVGQSANDVLATAATVDPSGNGVLVYFKTRTATGDVISANLSRVTRDGRVSVLARDANLSGSPAVLTANRTRIVIADVSTDSAALTLLARLEDGGPDRHFGGDGAVTVQPFVNPSVRGVLAHENGQVVVAGSESITGPTFWARLSDDGGLDTAFGADGGIGGSSFATDIGALVADDTGYLLGATRSNARGVLVRLTREGRVDPSQWDGGTFLFPSFANQELAVSNVDAVTYQRDGAILALATAHRPIPGDLAVLVRVRGNELDPHFGQNGMTVVSDGTTGTHSLAIQRNGKAVVAWSDRDGSVRVARYVVE